MLTPYKLFRQSILRMVDFVIHSLTTRSKPTSSAPAPVLPELVEEIVELQQYVSGLLSQVPPNCENVCLVIDDNMYYRSMRYSLYQLARKCE